MLKKIIDYLILGLSVLLIFFLVFESYLVVPTFLVFAGRLHPLLLHFPIVLLILSVINSFTIKKPYQEYLLPFTVIITLLTAISGFFLGTESASGGEILTWHQWLGSSVALMAVLWYGIETIQISRIWLKSTIRIIIVIMIVLTGHFGGMITHGQDFLSWPEEKNELLADIPEDPLIFQHVVHPILEKKCVSCHNPDKAKGQLILTDYSSILKGGDSGETIVKGDPENSQIMLRIKLPLDHDDHMPPREKEQLTEEEILVLNEWIRFSASEDLKLSEIAEKEPLFTVVHNYQQQKKQSNYNYLVNVSNSEIQELSSDYYTIRRISEGSNALSVVVFPSASYEKKRLRHLKPIQKNIVELDLSRLPAGEEEVIFIAGCTSLEKLEINDTPIDDNALRQFSDLKKLKVLKAGGTLLTDEAVTGIEQFGSLEDLFIRDTKITESAIRKIKELNPGLMINAGIDPDISFTSILPVPEIEPDIVFFTKPFEITFKHPLDDIDIYYTTDGKEPENRGAKYNDHLNIDRPMILKYQAYREGWTSSMVDSVRFFKTQNGPDNMKLAFPPDEKYSGKGVLSVFDLEKGSYNLRDSAWMGFQKNGFELHCSWSDPVELEEIILSSYIATGIHVFPPGQVRIYGGNTDKDMKILYNKKFPPLEKEIGRSFNYVSCPLESSQYRNITIEVIPLEGLPSWHPDKGKPGWFFIDEIVLVKND